MSVTMRRNLPRVVIADDHILDRMPFLFAAVVFALARLIFRSLDLALGAINDELQTGTQAQHLGDIGGFAGWQLLLKAQGLVQDWGQTMNPLTRLGLTHAEEERLDGLKWVDLEVQQDEQQAISVGAQQRFATTTLLTFARLLALLLGLML